MWVRENFRKGACAPRERVVKEEKFSCTGKSFTGRNKGEMQNLREPCKSGAQKAKYREGCISQPMSSSQVLALPRGLERGAETHVHKPPLNRRQTVPREVHRSLHQTAWARGAKRPS